MLQLYKWAHLVSLILYLCHNQHLRFNPMIHMSSYSYPNEVHSHTELGFGWPRDTRCDSVWIPKLGHKTSINTSNLIFLDHSLWRQPATSLWEQASHLGVMPTLDGQHAEIPVIQSIPMCQPHVWSTWLLQPQPNFLITEGPVDSWPRTFMRNLSKKHLAKHSWTPDF